MTDITDSEYRALLTKLGLDPDAPPAVFTVFQFGQELRVEVYREASRDVTIIADAPTLDEGYTVIGVWLDDEPVPVGTVRGQHGVGGGQDASDHFEQGVWALYADGDEITAQAAAVTEMRATLGDQQD